MNDTGTSLETLFRTLARRLLRSPQTAAGQDAETPTRTIGITGCRSGVGVTTVAMNLACAAAEFSTFGVTLVDANVGHPSLDRMLGVPEQIGLCEAVAAQNGPPHLIAVEQRPKLRVVSLGVAGRSGVFTSFARFAHALGHLQRSSELVLIDLPALDRPADMLNIAGVLDGVLLVIEAGRSNAAAIETARRTFAKAGVPILGLVMNHADPDRS